MTTYNNLRADSPIRSVELSSPKLGYNTAFFHLADDANAENVKAWLSEQAGQTVISQATIEGHTLLITRGNHSQDMLLATLKERGDNFQEPKVEKKFNPWKWRGITSIVGQSLQLFSSWKGSKPGSADRAAIGLFASTNLVANITNITFGSQKKEDPHQLRALKERFNETLVQHLPEGQTLFSPDENRAALRPVEKNSDSLGKKVHSVARKYSVSGGEIGLRFFGASSLSFPITKWKKGFETFSKSGAKDAFKEIRNDNPITFKVGLITVLGKIISFCSKEPDPYNPKAPSTLDKIREKVTFPLSSVVEGLGAAWMAYDRFKNQTITFGKKKYPDFFGGVGNLVFITGYVIRFFAPYGSREVNMKELNAHITDSLAKVPQEKLPALLAQTAADLKWHFKEKISLPEIYNQLASDLKYHHHIDLESIPHTGIMAATTNSGKSFATQDLKKPVKSQAATHQERASISSQGFAGVSL